MASSAFAGRIREVVEDIHFRLTLPADGADDRPAETAR